MARRPAEGSLTGVLVSHPELTLPLCDQPHGRRAHDRITDRQLVFFLSYSASELQLVRLKPGGDIKACQPEKPRT